MSLTQKLVLYALAVALLPLAASGFTLVRLGEDAMRARIQAHQRTAAQAVAASIEQSLAEIGERVLTAVELTDPLRLSAAERVGLLRLMHRQSPAIRVAVLVDADGRLLAQPVTARSDALELAVEPSRAAVARLRDSLPAVASLPAGDREVLVSRPYFPAAGPARVAVAVGCCAGADGRARALAGVELALDADVLERAGIDTGPSSRIFVVDGFGRVIAHPTLAVGADLSRHGAVQAAKLGAAAASIRYAGEGGFWAAAVSPVARFGWSVVVEQPEVVAFAEAASMRTRTVSWITATTLVVVLTGMLFAGQLRRRLTRLMHGARAFASGKLSARVPAGGADELGELAATLNGMAADLERSLGEIDAWGRTLEDKVDERTRELRDAQAQLLLQSKLAAIGQLGAGVAHEVNNPLAGILGYAQLLLRKHGPETADHTMLQRIEEAAQRCKTITTSLLRFSQRGLAGRARLEVNGLVGEVLDLMAGGLEEAAIAVERELAADAGQVTADAGQLSLVLINIVGNARNAMASGGTLTVRTAGSAEDARVTIADTGHGIEAEHLARIFDPFFTTKKKWTGVGLGLSVAYRVVRDHGGRIEVASRVGEGSTFTVILPRVPPPASELESARPQRPVLLA